MLKDIEETSTMISLEAQCGHESFENAFAKLPGLVDQLRSFLSNKIGDPLSLNFLGMRPHFFIRAIGRTTYLDFKHVTLYVPAGLNVPYLAHQKVLEQSSKHCLDIERDVLDPLTKWLGERVGNPTAFSSVTSTLKAPSGTADKLEKDYQAQFISNGQKQSEVPYSDAIGRQGDWETVVSGLEAMEKQLSADLHERLLVKMKRLDDLLSTLVRRIEENPESYKFSAPALSDLATHSYAAARQLEFYGLTKYRLQTYATAVRESVKKLEVFVK